MAVGVGIGATAGGREGRVPATAALYQSALDIDRRPFACADRADTVWVANEPVPCLGTGGEDLVVAVPDLGRELVAPQILPDVLHGVQFRRIRRQRHQHDVVGHFQVVCFGVPAGTVTN